MQYLLVEMRGIYLSQAARKRKIGRSHIEFAMARAHTVETVPDPERDPAIVWIGPDDRGVELEIIAVVVPDKLLIIHVMPTTYRR